MIPASAIIVTLFLGGLHFPGIPDGSHGWFFGLVNIFVFFAKITALLFVFIWVRFTLPRFRYDQLMRLGWVFFFSIALVNIFCAAAIIPFFDWYPAFLLLFLFLYLFCFLFFPSATR